MLLILHVAEQDGWYHLIADDESWFFFNTPARCIWTLSTDTMVTKPRLEVQSKISRLQSCETRATSMLSTDSQMIENEQRLFCDKYAHST
jgi:hypothetical protein